MHPVRADGVLRIPVVSICWIDMVCDLPREREDITALKCAEVLAEWLRQICHLAPWQPSCAPLAFQQAAWGCNIRGVMCWLPTILGTFRADDQRVGPLTANEFARFE